MTSSLTPSCFISYSWDDNAHKDWVRRLATDLQSNSVVARLDQWDTHPGSDLTSYMETAIRSSEYVVLVCTPLFAKKANVGQGGVGYEKTIVTGEIFQGIASPKKFVPILRRGGPKESLPSYLKSKYFIDFRIDQGYPQSLEDILRHI
ncbi:MAG: toll/interleukin-1 receptor domain-containing protein [Ignavibacteriales bacterium]|nr:toll/interleukin-1 receptor domain-containing protein [Ignavibacteriales bacterium]